MKKYQLMAPGPTPVPPNVLLAMARPIIHHRAAEYDALFLEVREGLKRLVQTREDVLTPACTGTGAMEAAVANTLSAGDRVIVVNAGEADAHVALLPASPESVTREYFTDQMALFDYALKAHVDALKKATDAVRGDAT